jgi:hypothetical protein
MKIRHRERVREALVIKTIEITCERSPADCILYLPAFDDPIVTPMIANAVSAAGD